MIWLIFSFKFVIIAGDEIITLKNRVDFKGNEVIIVLGEPGFFIVVAVIRIKIRGPPSRVEDYKVSVSYLPPLIAINFFSVF